MAKSMFTEFGHEMANSWTPVGKKEVMNAEALGATEAVIAENDWVSPEGKKVHFINVVVSFKNGTRKSFKLTDRDGQPQYSAGTKIDLDTIALQKIMDSNGVVDVRAYCKAE